MLRIDVSVLDYAIIRGPRDRLRGEAPGQDRPRLLPLRALTTAWITGLAFIAANLGALEVLGMAANGAQYGVATVHFYWIGAVSAMVFLGLVMMPFYHGSTVRSVPEWLRRRYNRPTHLFNSISLRAGHGAHRRGEPVRARPGALAHAGLVGQHRDLRGRGATRPKPQEELRAWCGGWPRALTSAPRAATASGGATRSSSAPGRSG
jgi:Sodium:solute symporter family